MKSLALLWMLATGGCFTLDSLSVEACDSQNNCLRATAKIHHNPSK